MTPTKLADSNNEIRYDLPIVSLTPAMKQLQRHQLAYTSK
jgi:hypothetical protein